MKDARQPLSAKQVRSLVSSSSDDVTRMYALKNGRPVDRAAIQAMVEGLGWWQWRVAMGCAFGLGGSVEGVDEAVRGLVSALSHYESSVRSAAAESLAELARSEAALPLFQAYLAEESHLTVIEIGQALLATPLTTLARTHSNVLQDLLQRIESLQLSRLPLGGTIARRLPPSPTAPPVGFFSRLFRSAPRPPVQQASYQVPTEREREFLTREGDQIEDYPGIVDQLAEIWERLPGDRETQFQLVLKLCRMPLTHFQTTSNLVHLAARMADTKERQGELLSEATQWTIPSDPTRPNRLACGLARSHPELRLPLFVQFLALGGPMDWTNWAYPLSKAGADELEPLVAAANQAPKGQLEGWMRLFGEAPVGLILPFLARTLHCGIEPLVKVTVERLKAYGQPVPEVLGDTEALKQRWNSSPQILSELDSLVGQSRRPDSSSLELPPGLSEPVLVAEWTLPETMRNPFSNGQAQSWTEALRGLSAVRGSGGELYLLTTEALVEMASGRLTPWPDHGHSLTLIAEGVKGELLFQGWGGSNVPLYLWTPGGSFRRLEPPLPDDEVPNGENLVSDGRNYGWAEAGVWKMSHFESDPGHHEDIAYRLDRSSGKLSAVKAASLKGMSPVEARKLSTDEYKARGLQFTFSPDGAFRSCVAEGFAIRAGAENPMKGEGRASGKWALYLEVFPSRVCRVYVWQRQPSKEAELFSVADALEAMMADL